MMTDYDEDNDINNEPAMVKLSGTIQPSWKDIPIVGDMELAEIYGLLATEGITPPEDIVWGKLLDKFPARFGSHWHQGWDNEGPVQPAELTDEDQIIIDTRNRKVDEWIRSL